MDEVVVTVDAKYVFLDIVGFTRNRSVEAQSDIVGYLNGIVNDSLASSQIPESDRRATGFFYPQATGSA